MKKRRKRLVSIFSLLMAVLICGSALSASALEAVTFSGEKLYSTGAGNIHKYIITGGTYQNRIAYCFHHGAPWTSYDRTAFSADELESCTYWTKLSDVKQKLIKRLMVHSYPVLTAQEMVGANTAEAQNACIVSTQALIWEVVDGYRDANGVRTNNGYYNGFISPISSQNKYVETAYAYLDKMLRTHSTVSNFMSAQETSAPTVKLAWDRDTQRYQAVLTDASGVLGQFKTSYTNVPSGLHIERSGNTLTLWSKTPVNSGNNAIRFQKDFKTINDSNMPALGVLVRANDSSSQELIVPGVVDDPVYGYLKVSSDTVQIHITKTVFGAAVSSGETFTFRVTSNNGWGTRDYTTDTSGQITIRDLPEGTYTVSEVLTAEQKLKYKTPAPQTKTVTGGGTASFSFNNTEVDGELTVYKVDLQFGQVQSIPFRVEHTDGSTEYGGAATVGNNIYNWYYLINTDESGAAVVTSAKVTQFYRDYIAKNTGKTDADIAKLIAADLWENAARYPEKALARLEAVITALKANANAQCVVEPGSTYTVTELGWAMESAGAVQNSLYYNVTSYDYAPGVTTRYENRECSVPVTVPEAALNRSGTLIVPDASFEFSNVADGDLLIIKESAVTGERINGVPFIIEYLGVLKNTDDPLTAPAVWTKRGETQTMNVVTSRSSSGSETTEAMDGVIWMAQGYCDAGWYRITEDPDWCIANGYEAPAPQTVEAVPYSRSTVTFANKPRTIPVNVFKESADGAVEGFAFSIEGADIWGRTLRASMTSLVSDSAGQLVFAASGTAASTGTSYAIAHAKGDPLTLYPGSYTITEHLTDEQIKAGYVSSGPWEITVEAGQEESARFTAYNTIVKRVMLRKNLTGKSEGTREGFHFTLTAVNGVDAYGNEFPSRLLVSGAGGWLYPADVDWTVVSDSRELELPPGDYLLTEMLTEEQTADGYEAVTNPIQFSVGKDDWQEEGTAFLFTFTNKREAFPVPLKKTAAYGSVEGFTFRLFGTADNGTSVTRTGLTSGADGMILDGDGKEIRLYPGSYELMEILTDAQRQHWRAAASSVKFTVTSAGKITVGGMEVDAVEFANIPLGSITLHKQDGNGGALAGAEFLLEYSLDGGRTWNTASASQCGSAGLTDGRLTTGADGTVTFAKLPMVDGGGTVYRWRVTETKAPDGYALLAQPVFEGELPAEQSIEVDGQAVESLSLDVALSDINHGGFDLPPTGQGGFGWPPAAAGALAAWGAAALVVALCKRRQNHNRKGEKVS